MKVAIVGAGLMGRLLAWRLSRQSIQVTLYDKATRQSTDSCGCTAAGMLAPFAERDKAEPTVWSLGEQSLGLWTSYLDELEFPVYFQQSGTIITSHSQDRTTLMHYIDHIGQRMDASNLQRLSHDQLQSLEPELNTQHAYWIPQEGQIDAQGFMNCMAHILPARIDWREEHPVARCVPYQVANESYDWVIDCRGLGAKPDLPKLRGVRGEVIWLHAPDVTLQRPIRMMHPKYNIYLVPRPNHQFIIGASEIESDDQSPISVRTTLELLSAAYSLHSGFAEARVIHTATNCRPALPDHCPSIVREPGLIRVNGLFRHGWLIAPAIAEQVMQEISHA